jgi:hypothetical protein
MDPNTRALMMGAGGASSEGKTYVEDVFSTWLYTGTGSTQAITNGIDLAGKGGLVWLKTRARSSGDFYSRHFLYDSARGLSATSYLHTDASDAQGATGSVGSAPTFLSNGFTPGPSNLNTETYASWTFRKAPKFFDVVTYTGNGVGGRVVPHNLGSTPGFVIIKRVDSTGNWFCSHRDLTNFGQHMFLNQTAVASSNLGWIGNVTSTQFQVYRIADLNASGATYVAYLFAHDAGGFGDSGNESVVKCGSYTGNGSATGPTIDLGWEPQWLLIKQASGTAGEDWYIYDSMRGIATGGNDPFLRADLSASEVATSNHIDLLATGFQPTTTGTATNQSGTTYIYLAIA